VKEKKMKRAKAYAASLTLFLFAAMSLSARAADNGVESLRQTGKAFAAVAKQVSPSVVFIRVESKASSRSTAPFSSPFESPNGSPFGNEFPFGDDFFRRFFGESFPGRPQPKKRQAPQRERMIMGQGSGFVFKTEKGAHASKSYILTNNHVVKNADRIRVQFKDGREFDATVTGRDSHSDVAVIEVKAADLPALRLGDSSQLEVGEWVIAIGNPFGLSHTLTAGVVSAKGRTSVGINDYEDFIQTDAAINPGNSGGPLVNLNGEVVGINTAIFSRSGGYMGIGFAIPSNLASTIANQLIEHGEVTRGQLGVVIQPLTPELAKSFETKADKGILIASVNDDSPAKKAGLKQGDVILKLNDEPIIDIGSFRNRVALMPPGTSIKLTILRNGKHKTVNVKVGKASEEKQIAKAASHSSGEIGFTVQTLTPQLADQYDLKEGEGVLVSEVQPGSIAAMAGIRPGTIILQVEQKPVKSAEEFQHAIKTSERKKRVLLLVRQGEMQRFVALSW